MIGSEIGRYKIVERLGAGGMGEVYRAEDTTLGRPVALKFLAAHLLNDDEAKQRFLREAKAAAVIRNPNICTVFEVGEENGKTFLAMDYLEGESLEDRIAKGPLPLKDALDIGRQIAEGLKAAHEKGIVHRDIKPANIMVDAEGRATILDFGLARLTEASKLTRADQTVGTAAYMSPEQIQGSDVDHRTDIWALGCVLYEMVAGVRPFKGQYEQALLYEICNQEPEPLTGVRAGVPMELEVLVAKCLAKDASDRYDSTAELAKDLRTLGERLKSGRSTVLPTGSLSASARSQLSVDRPASLSELLPPGAVVVQRGRQRALQAVAALALLALAGLAFVHFSASPGEKAEKPVRRFSFVAEGVSQGAISPDGKYVTYSASTNGRTSLWLRPLASESARELHGTVGVLISSRNRIETRAFWSPDSKSIAFAVGGPDLELKRVSIDGGDPTTLCKLPSRRAVTAFLGGTWSRDGERIVFSSDNLLYEIPARGGEPRLLFDPGDGPRSRSSSPHFLPAGKGPPGLAYEAHASFGDRWITVLNLETGESRELGPGVQPVYSLDGFLLHGPAQAITGQQGLGALPFSLETLQATGEDFPVNPTGMSPTVSADGTLAYLDAFGGEGSTLVWRDRSGRKLETIGQAQPIINDPALSPDGSRVAVSSAESGNREIWVHDRIRSTKTRLTLDDLPKVQPAWLPSGLEIGYLARTAAGLGIRRASADGTGEPVNVIDRGENPDWSRDGRYLVYSVDGPDDSGDIRYVQLGSSGQASEPVTFLSTPANERGPKLSPDGRFVAYVSDESGRDEIYVRSFPDGARKWQASFIGGGQPRWRGDGTELYYVEGDMSLMAVAVSPEDGLTLGRPQKLFDSTDLPFSADIPQYDVTADGQRFVTIAPVESADKEPAKIHIVENWYEELRNREQD